MKTDISRQFIEINYYSLKKNDNIVLPLWMKYSNHIMFFILSILFGILGCSLICYSMPDVILKEKTNFLLFITFSCGFILNIISSKLCGIYMKIKHMDDSYGDKDLTTPLISGFTISFAYSLISATLDLTLFKFILICIGFIFFYAIPIYIEKT